MVLNIVEDDGRDGANETLDNVDLGDIIDVQNQSQCGYLLPYREWVHES